MSESTGHNRGNVWAAMARLAREIHRERDSVDNTLHTITALATDTVPGTAYAGITLLTGRGRVESRAETSPIPRKLDELQTQLGEGPCLQAAFEHDLVSVPDLTTETRWPRFTASAVDLGVGSMLSFQLYTGEHTLGALNLFATRAGVFDTEAVETGLALATHAALALLAAQDHEQLHSALARRDIIGQAKGMIMERFDVNAVRAFELLTKLSQESNIRVAELARILVEREHPSR